MCGVSLRAELHVLIQAIHSTILFVVIIPPNRVMCCAFQRTLDIF